MKKRYLLFEALTALNPKNTIKYTKQIIANKAMMGLCIAFVLAPLWLLAQNATPILDLNSPRAITNNLSTNASNLNTPLSNGWTRSNVGVSVSVAGIFYVDDDNPNYTATSPAVTGMNLGPSPAGAGQIIVGWGWNQGAPAVTSGFNITSVFYGGVEYARMTTTASTGSASVTYLNGATNASGNTTATAIAPTGYKAWTYTMITINLPNGVPTSGNIVLAWNGVSGLGQDDIAIDYVIANTYPGDGNYNFTNTFTENGSGVTIADSDMSITDDGTNISGATITLTNPQTGDALSILGSLPAGISAVLSAGNSVVTLSGSASVANYETAIKQILFANSSENPSITNRIVNVVVSDASAVASNTAVTTITVIAVNDPPSGTDKTISVLEDGTYTFAAADFGFSDPIEGNSFQSVTIATLPSNGVLKLNGVNVTANQVIPVASIPQLTWTQSVADANGNGLSSFTFKVTDNGGTANGGIDTDPTANTITFNVTPVADITNDAISTPQNTAVAFNVITGTGGATADTFENASPQVTSITQPVSGGSVTFSANGSMVFTPTTGFTGATSFTYTVTSGGVNETATVTLNVSTPVPCTSGTVYTVNGAAIGPVVAQQGLYIINPVTEATTLVQANLYGGGAAKTVADAGGDAGTSALALDISSNTIWFANRAFDPLQPGGNPTNAADPVPKIFSYNLNNNVYGVTYATFTGLSTFSNLNKAAYNPYDKQVYFHNASTNRLYRFNPATPTVAAVDLGSLSVTGVAGDPITNFAGGDIAFDGIGNLTGAFTSANIIAVFPAQYDVNGNFIGLSLTGQKTTDLVASSPSSVAFLSDGNYLVGGTGGTSNVNSTTGVVTDLGATNFSSTDFASCAAPAPNLIHRKTAVVNCLPTGSSITYTITVQNTGQFHAINTRLLDALPAGVTVNSATLNGVAIAGISNATLTAGILIKSTNATTDGQVLKGETATIVLNCTANNSGASISNQSFVKYNGIETLNLANDQLPSDDPATVAVNDATTVTLCNSISGTVYTDNDGQTGGVNGTPFSGVTVTLYASNGTTVLATTVTDGSGNYSFGATPNNYVVGITLPAGYQNSSSTDATPTDGQTAVTVVASVTGVNFGIRKIADVSITKISSSGTPNVGSNVTFTLTASNAGPSSATNVSATDVLPSGYTFVSATPSGSTTYNSGTGVWTIGTLANGANATLSIVATVKATGSYANTVTITSTETDPTPGNNTSTTTPVPVPVADVSIAKISSSGTPNVGSNITFTLTASNAGPSSATGINATDVLPSGYTFVSATPSGSTTYNSGTGLWTIGTLANGANATLSIVATVKATGTYANTATITSTESDPTPGNNTSTTTPVPVPVADVSISKISSSGTPNVGSNVTFTMTASNAGPSSATNVSATDVLPSGYTFVSATPSGSTTYNSGTGLWTIGTLANGANATLSIVATVKATGTYANTATITSTETDPAQGNNSSTATPVPVPVADVSISKISSSGTPNVDSNVTFTLTASNAGPSSATNVSATDVLPSGYTFVSATPSGSTTYNSGTGVWTIGTLANGANATLSIVATVKASGSYANTVTITSTETDPTPGNNTSTTTPVPVPVADVSIAKISSSGTPNVGSNITFTLTASNAGPSSATGVTATDVLPSGYTFVSATPSGSTAYNSGTGVWTIGTLANGANATLSIIATVKSSGSYANTATITSAVTDPTPGNNTSTTTPVPVPVADVSINKISSSGTPNVGSNVTFTLTASNVGPSSATNVSATDVLPSGYTFVSATPSGSTIYNSGTGVWTIGTLANGANATLSIVATVKASGTYGNTATITATESDPTPANNTSTATPVPVPIADVSISKISSSGTPNVGSNVTFTLTASNAGPSSATGVSVADLLPSGYTFVSGTPSGSTTYNSGTGLWTIGTLANGANETLSIIATVKATGSYANTATITATESDPTPANNTSTSTPVPVPIADVSISKISSSGTPNVGSNITFTLTASNAGPSSATGVTATDVLPSGYTFVSATPSGSTTYNSGTGVWNIGTLANGANATLSIVAMVKATGSYANTATITSTESDPIPANNTSTSTPVPAPVADVSISKISSSGTPNVGSNITFTLTASNAGPSSATGVSVADLLPSGYAFVSATPSGTTTYNSGTGVWTIGTLANGANATLSIVATVKASGTYGNTATITATESDPTPANNTSTATPVPVPIADVSINKISSSGTPNVGSNVTFTLTASNAGPSSATNVSATDVLPSGYTFVSATPSGSTTYNSGTGLWTIGTLANGANETLSIIATVKATGSYANTATITATESDPTPANNTSTSTPVPVPIADVSISKISSSGTPNVGSNVTFTLTASNAGPSLATNVSATDVLPSGYTFVSATPSGSTTYNSGTGVWNIGTLANGANATLSIVATVKATGSYANTATITSTESDPIPANNTSTSTPVPAPVADVSISKISSSGTPNVGNNVTFTLTASNAGPSSATNVSATDVLPSGYTFVSATPSGSTTYNSGTGVWTIGTLANGANATLSIVATVKATGSYANTATITSTETDPTPGNNTSTTTPVPVPIADVSISKISSSSTPNVGSNVTFTLTASNAGPSSATGVSVADLLPSGYTFVSATPSGSTTYNSGTGLWTIGTLANGANATLSIIATVKASGSYANTATITSAVTDPTPGNNSATSTPIPVPIADVMISKTSNGASSNVGDNVTFTLTASNAGPSSATGVSVTDLLPSGYTFVSAIPSGSTTYNNGTGVWTIGALANGTNATLNIVAKINATGSYANVANITATETDPNTANNTSTVTLTPGAVSDVSVTKIVNNATPNVGSNVTFTLTASNAGPSAATGVKVNDLLPTGYNFVSATPSGSTTYNNITGLWTIGTLNNVSSATLSIIASVNAVGNYANTATITGNETDPNTTNNTATATTTPVPIADVTISKISSSVTPNVGSNVTFTLTASNAGPSTATGVSATDVLPSGYTFVAATPSGSTTYNNGTGVWTIGTLANGANATLSIVATVKATGSYANTATITSTESDPTPGNNTSTTTPVPVPIADVSINKISSSGTPNVGGNVTFTLTASNAGPSSATGVSVADLLPTGYTFVSATPSGSTTYNSGTGVWNIGTLANGANATLSIVATVKATGGYGNTATISATENDPTPGNNTSTSTPVPVPVADVSINKISSSGTPNVGSNVTFTLTAGNAGPSSATGVKVNDLLPTGYTFVSATPSGSTTYNSATGLWTIGTLANGANATLTIVATVNASGSYANTATISATESDPTLGNNTSTSTPVPVPVADVSINKISSNGAPNVGSNVTFTLTASNAGPSSATGVSTADLLPSGYIFVSATPSGSTTYNSATGVWTIGTLTNGANATLSIVATVKATGNYANTATITATESDPTPANNTSTSTPVPVPVADVSINKISSNGTPNVGSNVTFTLTASNAGPSSATGVSATDLLPTGYTFVSATPSGSTTYNSGTGVWTIGTLTNGANATLSIVATVKATGNYTNTATITATESDPTPANNTSTSTPVPVPVADVSINKISSNGTPNVGSNVTFTLTASNAGPSSATGVSATDLLPTGYTFVSATPSGSTTYNSGTGVWNIGTLANGTNATLSVVATVKATGNYTNTATITATENDPTPANNTSTSTPVPVPVADVSIAKISSSGTPNVGSNVTFTLTAFNAGPSSATGVSATDVLPTGYTFVSATPSGSTTYNSATGVWTIGTLANGANATLSIVATVKATGNYANTATITSTESDPTPGNNTSTTTPVPVPIADVSINKISSNGAPNVGSNVTFTLTASNAGPSSATGVIVTDPIPTGYTFVSATPSGSTTFNSTTGVWTISTLANGANATLSIVATVKATGNYANTATITSTESDPTPGNNTSTSTPVPVPVSDVSITKIANNNAPNVGSNVTFTLTAANAGPSDATSVKVNDLLPNGYTFVSATPSGSTTYNSATGVWTIGTLTNGSNATLDVVATVKATGNYANTASITVAETDLNSGNNSATSTPVPVPVADVSITKIASNNAPNVGSNVTFTLTAANAGPSVATNVNVTDALPNGYTFVSATPSGSTTYNNATGLWTIGALANGANATLSIVATVNATGNYANTATITATESDPTPGNNSATSTPVPVPVSDVSITKIASNNSPNVGSNVNFTLTANNAGPSDATLVKVNDLLPSGYTFVLATPSGSTTYNSATGLWAIGTLANGANATLSIVATVKASGSYANTASITATETDPTPGNNSATSTPVPVPVADVSITKIASNNAPNVGSNITFTLIANNAGPSTATSVKMNDLLPSGYTFVSASAPVGTTYNNATGLWDIGTLANGVNATLTITATVNATGSYANTATIIATESDLTPANNTSTSTPIPVPVSDVSVTKIVSNATPNVGSNVTFTVTASNAGPSNATSVRVNDLLPNGYTFVSATPSGSTTYSSATGLWTIGALANGANATLSIVATVKATGSYANTASITATENDLVPGNNSATSTPVPVPIADVSITKTANNNTPNVGSNITFTLTASNAGPSAATAVKVNDLLPSGYTFVSASTPVGTTYNNATGVWDIGTLANGLSTALTITATVNATGSYANTASITATETDLVPGNNSATSTPVPVAQADLSVVKLISKASPNVGSNVTFTLTVANAGPSTATNVSVTDALPSGYTFVSATPSGSTTYNNATGIWTIGTLTNGGNATLSVVATVNATGSYTNVATISATENDPSTANNTSSVGSTPVDVKMVKTGPTNANAGTTVSYSLVVRNDGTGNAVSNLIQDVVPTALTSVSWTATASGAATINSGANGVGNNVAVNVNIPAGNSNLITVNISGQLPANSSASSLSNTASITSPDPLDPVVNSNAVTTTVNKSADIQIQKTGPGTAVAGNNILYTITVTNAGTSDASNVNIVDNLPAGVNNATWTALAQNGASITGATNGTGSINLFAAIPAGTASVTITINGTIDANYASATLVNTATATPEAGVSDPTPATSTISTTISRVANVRITKSGPANIGAGEAISYNLHIINAGPSNATGVLISDAIPASIQNPTWTATVQNGATVSASNGTGSINIIGNIPAGNGIIDITISGTVTPAAVDGSNFSNTATATFPVGSPITDPEASSNTSTVQTTVNNTADIRVSKNGPANVNILDPITYTIVVTNAALGNVTGALINDNVPTDVTVSSWTAVATGGATITGATSGNTNTISTAGDIPADPNAKITITVQGIVNTSAGAMFTNTVTVTAGGNPQSSVTTSVNQSTDVMVEKNGTQSAKAGSAVSYTIKVLNNGPVAANGVTINDIVPADIENVTWSATAVGTAAITGASAGTNNTVLTTGNVPVGSANYLLITVNGNIKSSTSVANISNTASITLAPGLADYNLANQSSTVITAVSKETELSVVKTASGGSPVVGSNITFTIVASNAGPSDASGVSVTDLLPSGYTFVSANAPVGTTYTNATGVWAIGNLTKGASATLSIVATVNATGNYANTATITSAETDPTPGNNSSTVTPVPSPLADVSVTKIASSGTPNVGSNVTFTITASNAGPSAATGVSVQDLLPNGYTFVSANAPVGTSYNNATGSWTIGSLANGANAILTVTAKVNANGTYSNTATIVATEDDPNPANNSATANPAPVSVADISVVKTISNAAPNVGSNVTFSLTVANAGPSNATGVNLTDVLPTGYTFVSAAAPVGTTYNNGTGIWNIGTLANGVNTTLTITATVNATGNYTNTASVIATETDLTPSNNSSSVSPTPVPIADVKVTKTVDNPTPNVGSNVVFTITASNSGPSASTATGVNVNDVLANGYTFVSANAPVGTSYDNISGQWTVGNLANGATVTLTITAKVNATGSYSNTATISANETDPDLSSNSATVTPVPVPVADISVIKTATNLSPSVGTNVTFNITVSNTGPSMASNVAVTDLLPTGYTFVSAVVPIGTTYNNATGLWTIGNLNNGANALLAITATVNAAGNYTNTASASATEADLTPGNNSSSVSPAPVPVANVSVLKMVDNMAPNVGTNVVFTIKATNTGPSTASGVLVNEVLPNGYTFVSANAPIGTSYDNTTGLWTIGSLNNGTTATLTITAKVNATGSYTNTAAITATENDPDNSNNSSIVVPVPIPIADVSITKTASNLTPAVGSTINFTLTASNAGPSTATGVLANDVLPTGYTFVSTSAPAGTTYNSATGVWTIGNLGSGVSAVLTIAATVNATGNYTNQANITATETDPSPSNNNASVSPVPTPVADVNVLKTVDNATPNVGSNVVFTIKASNAGPSMASDVKVSDVLPSGYTFVSANAPVGTSYDNSTGLWTIGNLANGTNVSLTITAKVNASGLYANTANLFASEDDPTPGNNSSTVVTTPVAVADVTVVKTVDHATPNVGSNVVFTIKASNAGPSTATGVAVNDLLPNGYTFVSASTTAGTYSNASGLWTIGSLGSGANATLTITATVNATGSYANTASVSATESDLTPGNNTSTSTPVPVPVSNVNVVKTVDNTTPNVGSNVVFTIKANNAGPSTATGVVVNDALPTGYTFVSASAPVGTTFNSATGVWNIGNLNNGANATLTITAKVNATGNYTNVANITATESDPTPADNNSNVTPTPVPIANVAIAKTVDNATPNVGSNVVFTLQASNAGPSDATGVKVTDLLPSGYTFVSVVAPAGTAYDGTTGVWNIGALASGANATLTITAKVNASGTYTNSASITAIQTDLVPANNTSSITPAPLPIADVSVTKTIDDVSPNVGSNVVFTIKASNAGPSVASNVAVNDLLASGYTFVSALAPAGTSYNNATGVWTIGNLANGITTTLTITAKVNATGNYTNTASITATETDPATGNNSASVTPVPVSVADVSVIKTVDNATPNVGSNVVFTIKATNAGPSTAIGVIVNDVLPNGYTFVSASAPVGSSYDNLTGLWTIGNITNGGTVTLTITAKVNASGNYANTAIIASPVLDPDAANNSSTVTPAPKAVADISITKTINNAAPARGSNVTFTLTVTNAGPSAATGVTATDLLPSGYTFVSAVAPAGTTYNSTTGVWTIGNLTNGANAVLSITAKVNGSGAYANTATASAIETDLILANNSATVTPVPATVANLSIAKTVNTANPTVGSNVTFTIVASNAGPSDAATVTASDLLPSGYTFVSATPAVGTTYNSATGLWTIGTIASGANATLSITATVNATGNYANTATITSPATDLDPSNNSSTVTPVPIAVSNLSVNKTVNNVNPAVGSNVVFTINIANAGLSAATAVTVTDILASGYTFVSAIAPAGTSYNSSTGVWTIGTLANGASASLSITARVNATGNYANTASIISPTTDPDLSNNSSTVTPAPTATANIAVSKTVNNVNPVVGNNVVFSINVNNAGPSDATGVTATDVLPSGYTFVSANAPAGTTYNSTTGVWTIGNLANGANVILTVTARVNATGNYANTASINTTTNDPDPSNNSATATPVPIAASNLSVNKTVDNAGPTIGNNVAFSIRVANAGPSNATGVTVTDVLPNGYTFVSANAPAGTSYNNTTGLWTIGNLANGANITLTVTAKVNPTGNYANTAKVDASTLDPTLGDNTSTATPVPVANKPIAEDNTVATNANKPIIIPIIDNDNPGNSTFDLTSIEIVGQPQHGTVKVNSDGTVTYTPNPGYTGDDSFTYRIKDMLGNWTNVAKVSIKSNFVDIKIPNLFTPNGDGINDTFEIRGLNQFAQNSLVIVNRWGNEVFHSDNYQNTWTGEGLNEGTYYYLLKVKRTNSSEWVIYKGWLTLVRSFKN